MVVLDGVMVVWGSSIVIVMVVVVWLWCGVLLLIWWYWCGVNVGDGVRVYGICVVVWYGGADGWCDGGFIVIDLQCFVLLDCVA